MEIDLRLFRRSIQIPDQRSIYLSVIDISPDLPEKTYVFIHGFGGHARQWKYQLQEFSVSSRVIAVDLRGHGRSSKPPGQYTMAEILHDLEFVLDALKVTEKFVLVGHSFGGAVASEYSVNHPERVDALILLATSGDFRLNTMYRFLLNLPLPLLNYATPFTRRWLFSPPHVLKPWYQNTLSKWNGWELFKQISVPVLVVRGARDSVFEKPAFDRVATTIPNAEEINVGVSGHMVMLERHSAVNREIRSFQNTKHHTWRSSEENKTVPTRSGLIKERNWLAHYQAGVPFTISIPEIPLHQLLNSTARRFGRNTAILFEGKRLSYRRLKHEVDLFSNALLSLGVQNGDRVVLLLPNVPQMVIGFYGTIQIGAVCVLTLPLTESNELARQIKEVEAKILVTITAFSNQAQQVQTILMEQGCDSLKHILFTRGDVFLPIVKRIGLLANQKYQRMHRVNFKSNGSEVVFWEQLVSMQVPQAPDVEIQPHALAAILYTGGTTSEPKGVMLTHRNLVANTLQNCHWIPDMKDGRERFLCVLPFAHSYGLTAAMNASIYMGAAMILKTRFEVEDILKTIKRTHPTIFPGVPNMYTEINKYPGVRKFGISSIKACISGAAPLPVEIQETFEKLTKGILVEGYGLTEASPTTHANPLDGKRVTGSIGIPISSTEAKIVSLVKGKKDVLPGLIGELAIRGPQVMLGYWNNPKATRETMTEDGWLLTGDIAVMDENGYFRIISRKADMWYPEKPGDPAFPRDVEEVLYEIPTIKEAAVCAIAKQPVAFIIPDNPIPDKKFIQMYCQRRLPPELVPKVYIFVSEFPRTLVGKVLRRELALRYEQREIE